jgi:hypothetical protein
MMKEQIKTIEEKSESTIKWKYYVIIVLFILAGFTVWAAYLIINGSLSFIKVPISKNIFDDFSIICVLYFVGVFIAIAQEFGILGFRKLYFSPKKEVEDSIKKENKKGEKQNKLRHYIWLTIYLFVLIPIISAIVLYYIIYFIVYIFLGILPYIVSISMVAGLILSLLTMSRMVYGIHRGRKILAFSTLAILWYAVTIFLIYQFDSKTVEKGLQQSNQNEFVNQQKSSNQNE